MQEEEHEFEGHRIKLRYKSKDQPELLINNQPLRYGQLPDGLYFLHEYAYDPSDNLIDLARKFIAYKKKTDQIRREQDFEKGGGQYALS